MTNDKSSGVESLSSNFAKETASMMVGKTFKIDGKEFTLNNADPNEDLGMAAYLIKIEAKTYGLSEKYACNRIRYQLNQPLAQY